MNKLLEPYALIVDFLGEALGENVEIALHDLSSPKQEIVAIANGEISGRSIGAGVSNLSLHYLESKQFLTHDYVINYKTTGNGGKLLKSATYFIKDP
ncbi:MAG: PAS domain-containing protein, partial [bacterium]